MDCECKARDAHAWLNLIAIDALSGDDDAKRLLPDVAIHWLRVTGGQGLRDMFDLFPPLSGGEQ